MVGIVKYRDASRRQAVDAAAEKLISALRKAQTNAAAGIKEDCAGSLTGWQVNVSAGSYTIAYVCDGTADSSPKTENFDGAVVTAFPSPNPILFKVLNQGTNIPVSTTITLTGSITRDVVITKAGGIK